jgi:hypothetical protein
MQIWRHAAWHSQQWGRDRTVLSPEAMRFIKHTSKNARCRTASTLSSGLCVASASYLLARSLWWTASRRAFMAPNWKVAPSDLRSIELLLLDIGFDIGFPSARKFNCGCENT